MKRLRGTLIRSIPCAACSRFVNVAVEGTDQDFGVLCRFHKSEVAFLRDQLKNKSILEQDFRQENQTLKNSWGLQELERKEQEGQRRGLETQLTEQEAKIEQVKKKLGEWKELLTKHE